MKLKFKNTNINYAVTETKNKEGLASNDSWLMVDFYVENDEFSYHSCRESLSLGEIVEACNIIHKLYDEPIKVTITKDSYNAKLEDMVSVENTGINGKYSIELKKVKNSDKKPISNISFDIQNSSDVYMANVILGAKFL